MQQPYAAVSVGLLLPQRWAQRQMTAWEALRQSYRSPSTPRETGGSRAGDWLA